MMLTERCSRLFHTIRFLRFEQIRYRLYYCLRKLPLQPLAPPERRRWPHPWQSPTWLPSCLTEAGDFNFLGEKGRVETPADWNDPNKPKLWLYNLHYLDELNSRRADSRVLVLSELINRWTADNLPLTGNGWEPYPLSLRLVNLVKWYARWGIEPDGLTNLNLQAQALSKQLEYHILGNHLFANGKAMVFAGAFIDGDQGKKWLELGLKILDREIPEQFLADGAHFELSPMYHATMLWDMGDLIRLADFSRVPALQNRAGLWRGVMRRGLQWLAAMIHPDKEIAFFNDATLGIAPTFTDLNCYAVELECAINAAEARHLSLHHLKASGYIAVSLGNQSKALLDVAQVGPDYQPGHAHADTLSFELSLWGQRVFVNSGISQYGEDAERQRQRSTLAHNTVVVDRQNSSEVWAGFRVARRAHPMDLSIEQTPDRIIIHAAHDGYERLPGKVIHRRCWDFTEKSLTVIDQLTGRFDLAEACFHLHPDVDVDILADNRCHISFAAGRAIAVHFAKADKVLLESTTWHPAFGVSAPNNCLVAQFTSSELVTQILWS